MDTHLGIAVKGRSRRYNGSVAPIDVTDATFQAEVLNRSDMVPVVVDLWAPWCGPCRTLGPIIEKVVGETEGKVVLVKINVDENPQSAAAFKVQSIPAVYALRDHKVVDGFIGAQPEAAIREFVAKLAPTKTPVDLLVEMGDEASLRSALDLEPGHVDAVTKLAEILIDRDDNEEALALLARIPETELVLRLGAQARLNMKNLTVGELDIEARLDELLAMVKEDELARQEYRDLLEIMGDRDQAMKYRRALASRLF